MKLFRWKGGLKTSKGFNIIRNIEQVKRNEHLQATFQGFAEWADNALEGEAWSCRTDNIECIHDGPLERPAIIEDNAYDIIDGDLISYPVCTDGSVDLECGCSVCKNVDGVDIALLDEIYTYTGWIYIRDYSLDECL